MRFKDLKGRTSLPVERLRERFRDDDVLTVLPVSGDGPRHHSVLVATPRKVAVVTGDAGRRSDEYMVRWAPWDTVAIGAEAGPADPALEATPDEGLAIRVGRRTFHALLGDALGRTALGDFIITLEGRRAALGLPG